MNSSQRFSVDPDFRFVLESIFIDLENVGKVFILCIYFYFILRTLFFRPRLGVSQWRPPKPAGASRGKLRSGMPAASEASMMIIRVAGSAARLDRPCQAHAASGTGRSESRSRPAPSQGQMTGRLAGARGFRSSGSPIRPGWAGGIGIPDFPIWPGWGKSTPMPGHRGYRGLVGPPG